MTTSDRTKNRIPMRLRRCTVYLPETPQPESTKKWLHESPKTGNRFGTRNAQGAKRHYRTALWLHTRKGF